MKISDRIVRAVFGVEKIADKIESTPLHQLKSVDFSDIFDVEVEHISSVDDQNYSLENIYTDFANRLSKLKYKHTFKDFTPVDGSKINELLNLRPNGMQTSNDLLHLFFYQTIKYQNGIVLINRDNDGNIIGLESVDVSKMSFGYGLDEINGETYLLWRNVHDDPEVVSLINYKDVIHLRYNPSSFFKGDLCSMTSFNDIPKIYDKYLSSMLSQLTDQGISGILTVSATMGDEDILQARGNKFANAWFKKNSNGILVLPKQETFQPLDKAIKLSTPEEIDIVMKYMYDAFKMNENIIRGTYTNAEYNSYYDTTLSHIVFRLEQELTYKLTNYSEEIITLSSFNLSGMSMTDISQAADKMLYQGVLTPNEVREQLTLEPYTDGDQFRTNLNAVEVNSAEGGEKT